MTDTEFQAMSKREQADYIRRHTRPSIDSLRVSLEFVARNYDPVDIVQILGECLDDRADAVALKKGDYDQAAKLKLVAKFLDGVHSFVANYDPTPD